MGVGVTNAALYIWGQKKFYSQQKINKFQMGFVREATEAEGGGGWALLYSVRPLPLHKGRIMVKRGKIIIIKVIRVETSQRIKQKSARIPVFEVAACSRSRRWSSSINYLISWTWWGYTTGKPSKHGPLTIVILFEVESSINCCTKGSRKKVFFSLVMPDH